jgi:hypothetical protein
MAGCHLGTCAGHGLAGGDVLTYLRVDRIQHLMPASDGLDNFVGIGGPDEGLWLLVVVGDEALTRLAAKPESCHWRKAPPFPAVKFQCSAASMISKRFI